MDLQDLDLHDLQSNYKIIKESVSEEEIKQEMAYQTAHLYQKIVNYKRTQVFASGCSYAYYVEDPIGSCEQGLGNVLVCGEMIGIRPAMVRTEQNGEDAACSNAAELLAALHGPECATIKQSVLMGRLLNWGKERGITEEGIYKSKEFFACDWAREIIKEHC